MAPPSDRSHANGSSVLTSALAGAILGAAAFAWWLLSAEERQRQRKRPSEAWLVSAFTEVDLPVAAEPASNDGQLRDRVQQLNSAIDDVRRQLEQLQTND